MIKSLDTALLQEFPLHAFAVHFTLHTSVRLTHFIPPSFASRYSVFESRVSVVVCLVFILSSARLYLLKELPFPLSASCLSLHGYSSSLRAWMLGYYVFPFSVFARVSLFFALCSAMIYSSCILNVCFYANGMKHLCKWLHVVNTCMLVRLGHNSSAGARCFGMCASSVTPCLRSF